MVITRKVVIGSVIGGAVFFALPYLAYVLLSKTPEPAVVTFLTLVGLVLGGVSASKWENKESEREALLETELREQSETAQQQQFEETQKKQQEYAAEFMEKAHTVKMQCIQNKRNADKINFAVWRESAGLQDKLFACLVETDAALQILEDITAELADAV